MEARASQRAWPVEPGSEVGGGGSLSQQPPDPPPPPAAPFLVPGDRKGPPGEKPPCDLSARTGPGSQTHGSWLTAPREGRPGRTGASDHGL